MVHLFSKTAGEKSFSMVTNLSGEVFKGYFPHFPLFLFFCMVDTRVTSPFSQPQYSWGQGALFI